MATRTLTDAEILAQIPAARAREARDRKQGLRAVQAKYDRKTERVVLELTNGYLFGFPVRIIPELAAASVAQRAQVELDVSGSMLLWDAMDVDLSVPGLLLSAVGMEAKRRHLASLVGSSTSKAKAAAARRNGKKGGRPRKKKSDH